MVLANGVTFTITVCTCSTRFFFNFYFFLYAAYSWQCLHFQIGSSQFTLSSWMWNVAVIVPMNPCNNPTHSARRYEFFLFYLNRFYFNTDASEHYFLKLNTAWSCLDSGWKQNDMALYRTCFFMLNCTFELPQMLTDSGKRGWRIIGA